ncbi:MAG: type II toxin-antitoxin system RelE/ParE family toxin [Methylococcaceae bacterium]|nr:MAG: type II toxin-antitoxin system RelE/ParE family toxin [Methylococcaceae bacterium]
MLLEITPEARRDLRGIADYIRRDKPGTARRVVGEILDRLTTLTDFPERGRPGRVDGTREAVLAGTPFIAVYLLMPEVVVIVRVLHGAQQWPTVGDDDDHEETLPQNPNSSDN